MSRKTNRGKQGPHEIVVVTDFTAFAINCVVEFVDKIRFSFTV